MQVPQTIIIRSGSQGEILGFISIDTTINGRSRGGLRLMPDVTQEELEKLAQAMTLKYGFLGLPQGGAKGGVIGDPELSPEERASVILRFARAAAPLLKRRIYIPDADMGTTAIDVQRMLEALGVRLSKREYRGNRSGDYTAGTVFEAARAAAEIQSIPLNGCRVSIEGFGKVGGPLAEMFSRQGARVVAISTTNGGLYNTQGLDITTLGKRARKVGRDVVAETDLGDRIALEELKQVDVDIFCPCARHDSVREEDVSKIPARIISCGANSPITRGAEKMLWNQGVTCVPDFVSNSGGVLGGTMEFGGWRSDEIFNFFDKRFRPKVSSLIKDAKRSGISLRESAEILARERFDRVKRQAESGSWKNWGMNAVVTAYHKGLLPSRFIRRMSDKYFQQKLG